MIDGPMPTSENMASPCMNTLTTAMRPNASAYSSRHKTRLPARRSAWLPPCPTSAHTEPRTSRASRDAGNGASSAGDDIATDGGDMSSEAARRTLGSLPGAGGTAEGEGQGQTDL